MRLVSSSLKAPPEKVTPAFDKANNGNTRNDTQSFSLRVMRSESASVAFTSCSKLPSRRLRCRHVAFGPGRAKAMDHVGADLLELVEAKGGEWWEP